MSKFNKNISIRAKLLTLLTGTIMSVTAQYSTALNIALTNDDGWDA